VTILGRGDLSPRRHQRSAGRYLTVLLVVAILAGGGYAAYVGFIRNSSGTDTATTGLPHCPKRASQSPYAAPHTLKVRIFNASLQTGLAAQVRSQLKSRGFTVTQIGNALRVGHDTAVVRYSPDQHLGALTLAAQVSGATTHQVAGTGRLELDLGLQFTQLRSAAAAKTAAHRAAASAAPSPSSSPTSSPSPSCSRH
jgi:LytR cell envelope-related transcriptional attenuator